MNIEVHRGLVLEELEKHFLKEDLKSIRGLTVTVAMILPDGTKEAGEDNGGVLRDLLSEYWNSFYEQRAEGNNLKVPALSPKMDMGRWKSIGCILAMGYYTQGYIPTQLSPAFMNFAMTGKEQKKENLLDKYLKYLSDTESLLIDEALRDFDEVNHDDLIDFFCDHGHVSIPTEENFRVLLGDVAHKELLQAPAYIAECWRKKLKLIEPFLSRPLGDISPLIPTFKNVWQSLSFEAGFPDGFKNMVKKYVKDLDETLLKRFLRYCTGTCHALLLIHLI